MPHGVHARKPCRRCGVPTMPNPTAKVPGICRDCRQVDPDYVRAIATGVPIRCTA